MWNKLAHLILKYRLSLIIIIGFLTLLMGYIGRKPEMSYDFAAVVPPDDPALIYFQEFKNLFGEDSNILAIGMKDSSVYGLNNFIQLKTLSDKIADLQGVTNVLSLPRLQYLAKDTATKQLLPKLLFSKFPTNQAQLDSLLDAANSLQFYKGQVINEDNGASLLLVAIEKTVLNSPKRQQLLDSIIDLTEAFVQKTGIEMHYAGVPYIRTVMTTKVRTELNFFWCFLL